MLESVKSEVNPGSPIAEPSSITCPLDAAEETRLQRIHLSGVKSRGGGKSLEVECFSVLGNEGWELVPSTVSNALRSLIAGSNEVPIYVAYSQRCRFRYS